MAGLRPISISVVGIAIAGAGITALVLTLSGARERVGGRVEAASTPVGSFRFELDDCASGHAFVPGFFGADLRGPGKNDLRVEGTGDEARLWLFRPGGGGDPKAALFEKKDCATWDVLTEWAHLTVNRVHTVNGHVHVVCNTDRGRLAADAEYTHCAL